MTKTTKAKKAQWSATPPATAPVTPPADAARASPPVTERRPRRRWARGVDRPRYLQPADIDRLGIMMVALISEVSALRDRLDTHEAVAELGSAVTRDAIEAYELTPARRAQRETERQAMLKRVLRVITEDREAALDSAAGEKS